MSNAATLELLADLLAAAAMLQAHEGAFMIILLSAGVAEGHKQRIHCRSSASTSDCSNNAHATSGSRCIYSPYSAGGIVLHANTDVKHLAQLAAATYQEQATAEEPGRIYIAIEAI